MVTIIDAKDAVMGRLASVVAKRILGGEEIVIVNSQDIIVTGEKYNNYKKYKDNVDRGDTTKRKGPFYPRRADLLFKRVVRGMIPWTTTSGREAYRRLQVHVGVPEQFIDSEKEKIPVAMRKINCKYTTLGDISKVLGSKVR
jgi:large subunit ribosomal protein L13